MSIKITPNQKKKLFQMCTPTEQNLLSIIVSNLQTQRLYLSKHAHSHVPNLTLDEIYYTLSDCSIVEFNTNGESHRVLVRANNPTHCCGDIDYDLCVVIDVCTKVIVSCWCNQSTDVHETLVADRYDATINIVEIAMELN